MGLLRHDPLRAQLPVPYGVLPGEFVDRLRRSFAAAGAWCVRGDSYDALLHLDHDHVCWCVPKVLANMRLRIRPEDISGLELTQQDLAARQRNPALEGSKRVQHERGVTMKVGFLAGLITVFEHSNFLVFEPYLVLVAIRLNWILCQGA